MAGPSGSDRDKFLKQIDDAAEEEVLLLKRISEVTGESLKNVRNMQKEEREALLKVLQLQQVEELEGKTKNGELTGHAELRSKAGGKDDRGKKRVGLFEDEEDYIPPPPRLRSILKKRGREKAMNLEHSCSKKVPEEIYDPEAEWGNIKHDKADVTREKQETSVTGSQSKVGSAKSPKLSSVGNFRPEKDTMDLARPDGTATWQRSHDKLDDKLEKLEKNLKKNAAKQESKLERKMKKIAQAEGAKVQADVVKVQAEVAKMQAEIARVKAEVARIRTPAVDLIPECPVCLQQLLTPKRIVQCLQGHKICEVCSKEDAVVSCPTCKTAFMGRDFGMEAFVRDITGKN